LARAETRLKSPRGQRPVRRTERRAGRRSGPAAPAATMKAAGASTVPESLLIVTGLSGSGKSYVFKCLEDMGYLCVDNLPLPLVEPLLSQVSAPRVGVILDVRNPEFASRFPPILTGVRRRVPGTRLLFLDASEESLIRRFSETRRPHPLSVDRPLLTALRNERELLEDVRSLADVVVDTSEMTVHELRSFMQKTFLGQEGSGRMVVSATSFGYKFGVPHDVDLLFDVRFLANPHFVAELKPKVGTDAAVAAYIEKDPQTGEFMERLGAFLDYLLPLYEQEHKSYLSIGIGCTGGRHRSVYVAEELARRLKERGLPVRVSHRDSTRE
ncbi:MAG TPA: RNase adapter RapZ, partial [Thermoanaerobaculia bacterium]|nr:RNase adapter RapZ [Thermoanaerobaculia bacterium]